MTVNAGYLSVMGGGKLALLKHYLCYFDLNLRFNTASFIGIKKAITENCLTVFSTNDTTALLSRTVFFVSRTVFSKNRAVMLVHRAVIASGVRLFSSTVRLCQQAVERTQKSVRFIPKTARLQRQPHGFSHKMQTLTKL